MSDAMEIDPEKNGGASEEFKDASEILAPVEEGDPMDDSRSADQNPNLVGGEAGIPNLEAVDDAKKGEESKENPSMKVDDVKGGENMRVAEKDPTLEAIDDSKRAVSAAENPNLVESVDDVNEGGEASSAREVPNLEVVDDAKKGENSMEVDDVKGGEDSVSADGNPDSEAVDDAKEGADLGNPDLEVVDAKKGEEGEEAVVFSTGDMVWGKIRSHPWWPGQIFDPKDASDMAEDHRKKGHLLVAYFGDKTFAWCDPSKLKPFRSHFSKMALHSSKDALAHAVEAALEEVSRRVELGLVPHGVQDEIYKDLKYRKVENAGIREGTCCCAIEKGPIVDSFEPTKLMEYVRELALHPLSGVDMLELTTFKAQLKSFSRSKGCGELPLFVIGRGLVGDEAEVVNADKGAISGEKKPRGRPRKDQNASGEGGKKNVTGEGGKKKSIAQNGKGEKSTSRASVKKQKVEVTPVTQAKEEDTGNGDGRKTRKKRVDYLEMASPSYTRNISSKVGDRMRKVASEVQGSPPIFKSRQMLPDVDMREMLSRLLMVAVNPLEEYSFLSTVMSTFTDFRVSVSINSSEASALLPLKSSGDTRGRKKALVDSDSASSEDLLPLKSARKKRGRKRKIVDSEAYSDESKKLLSSKSASGKRGGKVKMKDSESESEYEARTSKSAGRKRGQKKKNEDSDSDSASSDEPRSSKRAGRKRGRKKRAADSEPESTETPVTDSYWNDLLLQSSPERESASRARKRKQGSKGKIQRKKAKSTSMAESEQVLPVNASSPNIEGEKSGGVGEGAGSDGMEKQREEEGPRSHSDEKETPTALILSFNASNNLPSVEDLTKVFSRYGPLKEAETEVLRKSDRAKVVFRYRTDAEAAFSSAGKYSVFGPALVSYRLRYTPSSPKGSPEKDAAPAEVVTAEVPAKEETNAEVTPEAIESSSKVETCAEIAQEDMGSSPKEETCVEVAQEGTGSSPKEETCVEVAQEGMGGSPKEETSAASEATGAQDMDSSPK